MDVRVFIGVEFSQDIRNEIIKIQNIIRNNSVRGRWKHVDNFHLTLKFLGEMPENRINNIYEKMETEFENLRSFSLHMGYIGNFKGQGCCRVIYLMIIDKEERLQDTFMIIEESCALYGVIMEKRTFLPHITIAQDVVLNNGFDELLKAVGDIPPISIPVSEISIIKSEQIGSKRAYTPIRTIKLR